MSAEHYVEIFEQDVGHVDFGQSMEFQGRCVTCGAWGEWELDIPSARSSVRHREAQSSRSERRQKEVSRGLLFPRSVRVLLWIFNLLVLLLLLVKVLG